MSLELRFRSIEFIKDELAQTLLGKGLNPTLSAIR